MGPLDCKAFSLRSASVDFDLLKIKATLYSASCKECVILL